MTYMWDKFGVMYEREGKTQTPRQIAKWQEYTRLLGELLKHSPEHASLKVRFFQVLAKNSPRHLTLAEKTIPALLIELASSIPLKNDVQGSDDLHWVIQELHDFDHAHGGHFTDQFLMRLSSQRKYPDLRAKTRDLLEIDRETELWE